MSGNLNSRASKGTPPEVFQLPESGRLLLWAIRCWAAYHDTPQLVREPLARVFAANQLSDVDPVFAEFMRTVFAGLKRLPDIRCVRCPRLGKDELLLLRWLGVPVSEAVSHASLSGLLTATTIHQAMPAATLVRQSVAATPWLRTSPQQVAAFNEHCTNA